VKEKTKFRLRKRLMLLESAMKISWTGKFSRERCHWQFCMPWLRVRVPLKAWVFQWNRFHYRSLTSCSQSML